MKKIGQVRRFSSEKGFGFISCEESNNVFVHYTGIEMEGFKFLEEGQTVEFNIIETEKGLEAQNVTIIEGSVE